MNYLNQRDIKRSGTKIIIKISGLLKLKNNYLSIYFITLIILVEIRLLYSLFLLLNYPNEKTNNRVQNYIRL